MASATQSGLTICALSGTYNMAHPDVARRQADRIGFTNVVRAAQFMQVPLVTLCTGSRDAMNMWSAHPDNGSPEAWVALRGELDFALELAERHGVALGVEPEPGNVVGNARDARRLLDEIETPQLKIVMDAANLLPPESQTRQREVVAEAVALPRCRPGAGSHERCELSRRGCRCGTGRCGFPQFPEGDRVDRLSRSAGQPQLSGKGRGLRLRLLERRPR